MTSQEHPEKEEQRRPSTTSLEIAGGHYPELRPSDPFHAHPRWREQWKQAPVPPSMIQHRRHTIPLSMSPVDRFRGFESSGIIPRIRPLAETFPPVHPLPNIEHSAEEDPYCFNYDRLLRGVVFSPRCPDCFLPHTQFGTKIAIEGEVAKIISTTADALLHGGQIEEEALRKAVLNVLRQRLPQCLLWDFYHQILIEIHMLALGLKSGYFIPGGTRGPLYPIQLGKPIERRDTEEAQRELKPSKTSDLAAPLMDYKGLETKNQGLSQLLITILESDLLPDLRRLREKLGAKMEVKKLKRLTHVAVTEPESEEKKRTSIGSMATEATTGDQGDWTQAETTHSERKDLEIIEQETHIEQPNHERFESILGEMQETLRQLQLEAKVQRTKQGKKKKGLKAIPKAKDNKIKLSDESSASQLTKAPVQPEATPKKASSLGIKRKRTLKTENEEEASSTSKLKRLSISGSEHELRATAGTIPGYYRSLQAFMTGPEDRESIRDVSRRKSLKG